jgi:hypothetical protein
LRNNLIYFFFLLCTQEECLGFSPRQILALSTRRLLDVETSLKRLWIQLENDLPRLGVVPQRASTASSTHETQQQQKGRTSEKSGGALFTAFLSFLPLSSGSPMVGTLNNNKSEVTMYGRMIEFLYYFMEEIVTLRKKNNHYTEALM